MKGDIRCVGGRVMRHDPQPDDPNLETDRGVCPDCKGAGCDSPKVDGVSRFSANICVLRVSFSKPLTDDEMRDFEDYAKEWSL